MFIIATVEKYLLTKEHLTKLILAGADALRFNFSYRTIEENLSYISLAQQVIDDLNASIKTFIDFPINKTRLGDFELRLFPVKEADELIFKSGAFTFDCNEYIPVNTPNLGEKLTVGQNITIGDGEISLQVTSIIDQDSVRVKIQNKGVIQYMKTFNMPTIVNESEILKIYSDIIPKIKNVNHNYLGISYFNTPLFQKIYNIIKQENFHTKIVLKIEREIPLNEIDQLCQWNNFDALLIDRGELGVNMPYYKTGIYQKSILRIAKQYKKPIIISTQILESTMTNYIPNRAEILDLTNSVLEGVKGIMLCRETAINPRAAYSLSVARRIIEATENATSQNQI